LPTLAIVATPARRRHPRRRLCRRFLAAASTTPAIGLNTASPVVSPPSPPLSPSHRLKLRHRYRRRRRSRSSPPPSPRPPPASPSLPAIGLGLAVAVRPCHCCHLRRLVSPRFRHHRRSRSSQQPARNLAATQPAQPLSSSSLQPTVSQPRSRNQTVPQLSSQPVAMQLAARQLTAVSADGNLAGSPQLSSQPSA